MKGGVRGALIGLAGALLAAPPADAQKADQSIARHADDAFGISVGNERFGLYTEENVRGFSPTAAGNVRIEGLYFDRRGPVSARLVRNSKIRVGLTAQGYDFSAPSGIVDYALRSPSPTSATSVQVTVDSWDRASLEVDHGASLAPDLDAQIGFTLMQEPNVSGAQRDVASGALVARWRPRDWLEARAFASGVAIRDDEASPVVFTAGAYLPPSIPNRRFYGQDWTASESEILNHGLLLNARLGSGVVVRSGLFYSALFRRNTYADSFVQTSPSGLANHLISGFPDQDFTSLSGEIRVARNFADGPRRHTGLVSLRARDRESQTGGETTRSFGPAQIGAPLAVTEPDYGFRPRSAERVRQATLGLGYQGVWQGVGELNFGLQRTRYARRLQASGRPEDATTQDDWLWNLNAAAYLRRNLTLFGGYTRGLEDGGSAPQNATNANAALPATVSEQSDLGLRLASPRLNLIAAVFELRRPYYALDAANVFAPVGSVRSRGAELSVVATPIAGLRVVGGVVLTHPKVPGAGGDLRPLGAQDRLARVTADYAPPGAAWSIDAALTHLGRRVARVDNRVFIPAREVFDLGGRYKIALQGRPVTLRVAAYNLFDSRAWTVTAGGGYIPDEPRRIVASLYADF